MPHYYDTYSDQYYDNYYRSQRQQPPPQLRPRRHSQSQVYDIPPPDTQFYPPPRTQPNRTRHSLHYQQPQQPNHYPKVSTRQQSSSYSYLPTQRQDPRMFHDQPQYRQRRSSTGSRWSNQHSPQISMNDHNRSQATRDFHYEDEEENENEDDDESLNSLELLALENAKKNEKPLHVSSSPTFNPENLSVPISAELDGDSHHHHHHHHRHQQQQQQQQQPINDAASNNDHKNNEQVDKSIAAFTPGLAESLLEQQNKEQTKKSRWKLSKLFRKPSTGSSFSRASSTFFSTPSPSHSTASDTSSSSNHTNNSTLTARPSNLKQGPPSIVAHRPSSLAAAATIGEPDLQQRQQPQLSDAEKTAMLDFIWVFKASKAASQLIATDNNTNIWTGFDYKNQELLTNHAAALLKDQTVADPGLELFDSHIRKGMLPFLVVLNQQLAYYPTSNNTIDKIEIKCLPNTKDTVLLRKKKPV